MELPEAMDLDEDVVTISVELGKYSQFITYNKDDKKITVKPVLKQHIGIARVKVVLSDSKATRDYYIMFSVIDTNQKLNPFVAPLDFIGSGNMPFESGKPAASWPAGTGPVGTGNPDFG